MNWKNNVNTIKEIFPGHFQVILDFATTAILQHLIREDYQYVWVAHHQTNDFFSWNTYSLPLFDAKTNYNVVARHVNFDFVMPTVDFVQLLPGIKSGVTLTQLNELPPYYLDETRIKGKTRYDILKRECQYLFEVEIPSARDYGTLVSSDQTYLKSLLDNPSINWANLP